MSIVNSIIICLQNKRNSSVVIYTYSINILYKTQCKVRFVESYQQNIPKQYYRKIFKST